MSTFVLKRNYELELPTSFSEVDRAEMEYVDGGAILYGLLKDLLIYTWKFIAINSSAAVANAAFGGGGVYMLAAVWAGKKEFELYKSNKTAYNEYVTQKNKHRYCCQGMAQH